MALTGLCSSLASSVLVFRANQTRLSSQLFVLLATSSQASHAEAARVEKNSSMPSELEIGSCTLVDNCGKLFELNV
jgi:hypothetical protein